MECLLGIDQREDIVGHELHGLVVDHAHEIIDRPAFDSADPQPAELRARTDHKRVRLRRAVREPPDAGAQSCNCA